MANINLYGIDLNSMASSALVSFGSKLRQRTKEIQQKESNGYKLTRTEKKELEANGMVMRTVASQNRRLIQIDSQLKKLGVDLGSIRDLSYNSLTNLASPAIDKAIQEMHDKAAKEGRSVSNDEQAREVKLNKLKQKLGKGSYKAVAQTVFNGIEDAFKVTGAGLGIAAGSVAVANVAKAIGNIPLSSAQTPTVAAWVGANMPWLGTVFGLAIASGACLFIAKKMKDHQQAKDFAYLGAQEAQFEVEDKMIKAQQENVEKNKNVTVETEAARAETDPHYLDTLKANLGGVDPDTIIASGPAGNFTAAQYNAARIVKTVEQRAKTAMGQSQNAIDLETAKNDLIAAQNNIDMATAANAAIDAAAQGKADKLTALKTLKAGQPANTVFANSDPISKNTDTATLNAALKFLDDIVKAGVITLPAGFQGRINARTLTNHDLGSALGNAIQELDQQIIKLDAEIAKDAADKTANQDIINKNNQKKTDLQQKIQDLENAQQKI